MPGADKLCRIPEFLQVSGHWLLTGSGGEGPPTAELDLEAERRAVREAFAREVRAVVGGALDQLLGGAVTVAAETTPEQAHRMAADVDQALKDRQTPPGAKAPPTRRAGGK
jgi:hypothetical protein